jgi:hypothetical protein
MAAPGWIGTLLEKTSPISALAAQGRVFYASDADQNDLVTGQTSFAATTPTFLLSVPSGTTAIPLAVSLSQTGTVAGGDIDVILEIDNADRYSSSGTEETVLCARTTGGFSNLCKLYSGATASAGYGARIMGLRMAADVSHAEGAIHEALWTPTGSLDFLVGPASMLVYTYAGTTGPTWFWTVKWAEFPTTEL